MSLKNNLLYYVGQETHRLSDDMHDLSNKSRYDMRNNASLIAKDFKDLDIRIRSATKIEEKHIVKLVEYLQEKKYATSTIQGKITTLKHILHASGNNVKIPQFSLEKRDVLNTKNIDKSSTIPDKIVNEINDLAVKSAIKLATAYGLRMKEAIYTTRALSLRHDINEANSLILKGSWCKNGRPRTFKMQDGGRILQNVQAEILTEKLNLKNVNEQQSRNKISNKIRGLNKKLGLKMNMHGFRHAYAQSRYFSLTGMLAPCKNGLKFENMTKNEQAKYNSACTIISKELGHNRQEISKTYVGK